MPLGSSSAAPVISPGPSTRHKRGLLGPTTALGATEQLKLRSSDTTSMQSTWHSATGACVDQMIPQLKKEPLSTTNSLPVMEAAIRLPSSMRLMYLTAIT